MISGIKMGDLDPTFTTKAFTTHEHEVGHGWEASTRKPYFALSV